MTPAQRLAVKVGSAAALALTTFIGAKEGLRLKAYYDTGRVPTICFGETKGVKMGDVATREECVDKLNESVLKAVNEVESCVSRELPGHVKAAFASFAYNVGGNAFCGSTMARLANAGDIEGACKQFSRWVYVGHRDCRDKANNCYGIVTRRMEEAAMCRGELTK